MQDQPFQSLDEATSCLVRQGELQAEVAQMTQKCASLCAELQVKKAHESSIEEISWKFDDKLSQMSRVLNDFLTLQNHIVRQVDMLQESGSAAKKSKEGLASEIRKLSLLISQTGTASRDTQAELQKAKQRQYYLESIIGGKDEEISTLRQAVLTTNKQKANQKTLHDLMLAKMTSLENSLETIVHRTIVEQQSQLATLKKKVGEQEEEIKKLRRYIAKLEVVNDEIGKAEKLKQKNMQQKLIIQMEGVLTEYSRHEKVPTETKPKGQSRLNIDQDKYPKSFVKDISESKTKHESSSKFIFRQLEKLLAKATNSMTGIISKSSNQLISQLTERQSILRLQSFQSQSQIDLQEIRKKLDRVEASSKKAVDSLMNEIRSSTKQLLVQQLPADSC